MEDSLLRSLCSSFDCGATFARETARTKVRTPLDGLADLEALREALPVREFKAFHYAMNSNHRGRKLVDRVDGICRAEPGSRFLDIGCAYGGSVVAFHRAGYESVGVEISTQFFRLGRTNIEESAPGSSILCADFLELDLEAIGTFDIVSCTDVIEHVAEPKRLIERIAAVMRDGALAVLRIPNRQALQNVLADIHHLRFGIQLLQHHEVKAAHAVDFPDHPYTIGEFYPLDWYLRLFEANGLQATVAKTEPQFLGKIDEQLPRFDEALEKHRAQSKYDFFLNERIDQLVTEYLAAFAKSDAEPGARDNEGFRLKWVCPVWEVWLTRAGS
jgi:2-polyprenyl-3-methyl-5-hydroxy-6-metoxy-1,4-benzoquinol methylase